MTNKCIGLGWEGPNVLRSGTRAGVPKSESRGRVLGEEAASPIPTSYGSGGVPSSGDHGPLGLLKSAYANFCVTSPQY